ncbi:hypothetical protein [Massilia sp. BSC265]|uniref:hypothetical protein n=1 Tax=Massilia sp. BSC265 TaxID=1549812 RepID=UPI0004E95B7F|nr:hypothetical protein [Massilia sp. BSC265]KFI08145.1 hypothetical protein JN27_04885 [Massilia sp. BSC265]
MNPSSTFLNNADGAIGAESRRDGRQRDIVDAGIALMSVAGTLSALEYLKSHAVDARVIARVLSDPARRRSSPGLALA